VNAISRTPVPAEHSEEFNRLSQGIRLTWHLFAAVGAPAPGSNFDQVHQLYPFERVSDWAASYIQAAYEHLIMWADFAAPFKFHPDQVVNFALRPSYTLARAALESSAQAVWLLDTLDPLDCIRRHIRLVRWDLQEHRKSKLDRAEKSAVKAREAALVTRVSEVFKEDDIRPPNGYLDVLKWACAPKDLDLDAATVEALWRAASGAAHGKHWPNDDLQKIVPQGEAENGALSVRKFPDTATMVEMLWAGYKMSQYAALKYATYSGADVPTLMDNAREWVMSNITFRDDITEGELAEFKLRMGIPTAQTLADLEAANESGTQQGHAPLDETPDHD
jgi:hypothetical protein